MSGRFWVLEGLDGAGTTTQARRLQEARPHGLIATHEPTDGPVGRIARRSLRGDPEAPPLAALPWLFAADRADHLHRLVEPALSAGVHVLSDRYVPSSLAYQSLTLPLEDVWALNASFRVPDVVWFLDVPVDTALSRVVGRGAQLEIYDSRERLTAVHGAYARVMGFLEDRGWPITRIDGTLPIDDIAASILGSL